MVSGAVASTRSRSSSRLVAGVVGSRSGMETSIDGRCFGVVFVGMMLDDDMRMPHDSLNETEAMDWSAYHRCVIIYPSFFSTSVNEVYCLLTAKHA